MVETLAVAATVRIPVRTREAAISGVSSFEAVYKASK